MQEIKKIEAQFQYAFEGDAWYGLSIRELLKDVTAEQAAAKPIPGAHSIWEIVWHIAAWEKAACRRMQGVAVELSDNEDWPPVNDTNQSAWEKSRQVLENGHKELKRMISELTDARLEDIVPGRDYSVYYLLQGVIQHDLYHAGQIALLKKATS